MGNECRFFEEIIEYIDTINEKDELITSPEFKK
jgi:hypothetical protein